MRPSEPLLQFLRDVIRKKGLTTADLAARLEMERGALKKALGGHEPLLVDDFIRLAQILELDPTRVQDLQVVPDDSLPSEEDWAPDPTGNLAEQTLKLGFALGVDLFLIFNLDETEESGVPDSVRGRFKAQGFLPIKLDAAYHRHNRPRFEEDGFYCVLSFDRLYDCFFPWHAFKEVRFLLPEEEAAPPVPPPPKPGVPHLRLVK